MSPQLIPFGRYATKPKKCNPLPLLRPSRLNKPRSSSRLTHVVLWATGPKLYGFVKGSLPKVTTKLGTGSVF